jgi:hypothetical protein
VLRYGRYGHGGEYVANTDGDGHTYADGNSDGNCHAYADSDSDIDGHAYADSDTDGNCHTYADRHIDANGHTYTDGHTDANGHTDTVHGKMCTDAETPTDCGAASHATRSDNCHAHSRSHTERHARGSCSCSS